MELIGFRSMKRQKARSVLNTSVDIFVSIRYYHCIRRDFMDMRDKTELTFGEAMLHLNQVFNKRVFKMIHKAINDEIKRSKQEKHDGYYAA